MSIDYKNFKFSIIAGLSLGLCMVFGTTKSDAKPKKVSKSESFSEPYGMAGCGLFSTIITSKNRDSQLGVSVLRVLSGSIDSQTSGITSGTSNCVSSRGSVALKEGEIYVRINLDSLEKESAQGRGEHVTALAEILGCPHDTFSRLAQTRYAQIFDKKEPEKVFQNYMNEARNHVELGERCQRLS